MRNAYWLRRKEISEDKSPPVDLPKGRMKPTHESLANKIAGDLICYRNHNWKGHEVYACGKPDLQNVDKYYPYAKGGPLHIDEPQLEWHFLLCKEKEEVMRKAGLRYLVISRGMTEEQARSALEESDLFYRKKG